MNQFPGTDIDAQRKQLIERCKFLNVELINPITNKYYSANTLKSRCMNRLIENTSPHYKLDINKNQTKSRPTELPRHFEVGDQIFSESGDLFEIMLNTIGRRYWKKIDRDPNIDYGDNSEDDSGYESKSESQSGGRQNNLLLTMSNEIHRKYKQHNQLKQLKQLKRSRPSKNN